MTLSWHTTGQERPWRVFGMSNGRSSDSHERAEELESVVKIDVMTSSVLSSAIQHGDILPTSRREIRSRRVFFSMIWPSYTETLLSCWNQLRNQRNLIDQESIDLYKVWGRFPGSARWDAMSRLDRLISHLWRTPSCKNCLRPQK